LSTDHLTLPKRNKMKAIDSPLVNEWLTQKGLLDRKGEIAFSTFSFSEKCKIPVDSGKKTAISAMLCSFFKKEQESLLWINEYGIWPSSEDGNLFAGFRKSLGISESLFEKPGHVFSMQDNISIKSILCMVLYFCWGAFIIPGSKAFCIKVTHDEQLVVFAENKSTLEGVWSQIQTII
jgi:hypothetical protein